jgi:hypothetical protein
MAEDTVNVLSLLSRFFSEESIDRTARRTGFVKRVSKISGKLFLALMTFGVWSNPKTTLAQLAAKVPELAGQGEVSPEAIHQRMNRRALAFLQDLLGQALAQVHPLASGREAELFGEFSKVYLADSTGFGLPASLAQQFPGAGGSGTPAGAKIQAVWDYKNSVFGHLALTPWTVPDNKYVDKVVALAQAGVLFLFDLGYFKLAAFTRIAQQGAYFLSRLNHQTHVFATPAGGEHPLELPRLLRTVSGTSYEIPVWLGAKERVPTRLIAYRLPASVVNARRRSARATAKKKGYTPSKAHLALLAWNLFVTNVPATIWATETIGYVYPLRWQIELIFKAWKSHLHLAALPTTTETPTLCYLYGRMLLVVITFALSPPLRHTLWTHQQRELSLLKLVRHFQALADRWLAVLFEPPGALLRFLRRACASAARLIGKAKRKRRTSAQLLHDQFQRPACMTNPAQLLAA